MNGKGCARTGCYSTSLKNSRYCSRRCSNRSADDRRRNRDRSNGISRKLPTYIVMRESLPDPEDRIAYDQMLLEIQSYGVRTSVARLAAVLARAGWRKVEAAAPGSSSVGP